MFEEKPKLTIIAAAKELRVSRQSLHSYLNGTLPRKKTLNRAMHTWDLKLGLGTQSLSKEAFSNEEKEAKKAIEPDQPTLWEALDAVNEKDLHVTMKRVGKVLRVDVKIEIPA